jgi:hypothetical protein
LVFVLASVHVTLASQCVLVHHLVLVRVGRDTCSPGRVRKEGPSSTCLSVQSSLLSALPTAALLLPRPDVLPRLQLAGASPAPHKVNACRVMRTCAPPPARDRRQSSSRPGRPPHRTAAQVILLPARLHSVQQLSHNAHAAL